MVKRFKAWVEKVIQSETMEVFGGRAAREKKRHELIEEALETLEPEAVRDCYSILGLFDETPSRESVRLAYRRLIWEYHPDRVARAHPRIRTQADVRARKINIAYAYLKKRGLAR